MINNLSIVNTVVSILLIILVSSCSAQSSYQDESLVMSCICEKFLDEGVDIKSELKSFEKYLIENEVLKDSTGKAYVKFYQEISSTNSIPLDVHYSIKGIKSSPNNVFTKCLDSLSANPDNLVLNSPLSEFIYSQKKIKNASFVRLDSMVSNLYGFLTPQDFQRDYFRYSSLFSFYNLSNAKGLERLLPGPKSFDNTIEIVLNSEDDIRIRGRRFNKSTFADELQKLTEDKSELDLENTQVKIRCLSSVKMSVVSSCKMELRKLNYDQITYTTISEENTLELAAKLKFYADQILLSDSIDRVFWEKKFFNAFPASFVEMEELFGYDRHVGESPLYDFDEGRKVLEVFGNIQTISNEDYIKKYIEININGFWQADHISSAFGLDNLIISRPRSFCNAMNKFSDDDIKSVFRFIYDGPHPEHWENIKIANAIEQSLELTEKRILDLHNQAYAELLKEVKGK
ncbi:MAG: hypothetical protein AB8B53_03770 [Flavobacteriales bacterium]